MKEQTTVMMCHDLRSRAGALIDGELPGADTLALEAHAATCRDCAAVVAEQRVTRAVVGMRAAELRGVAPQSVRAAVERTVAATPTVLPFTARAAASRRRTLTFVSRWSVAAALILAVGGVFAAGALGESRLFAAQLALDHYKCLLIDHGHEDAVPAALEASWKAERGWSVVVPPSQPALGVTFLGIRRCVTGEGQVAHLMYGVAGQRVSLFIVPAAVDGAAADLSIMGVDTKSWTHEGRTYTLVGAPAATADLVADYLRAHAH